MSDEFQTGLSSERWDDRPPVRGRPLLTAAIGAIAVIVMAAGIDVPAAPIDLGWRFKFALTYALASGLFVWAICFAITLRKTSLVWKIASLLIILAVALLADFIAVGRQAINARKSDARQTVNQLERAQAAGPDRPIELDADAGPMARLTAIVGNMMVSDSRGFRKASEEAGLDRVISLQGLRPDAPLLDHCDRITALGARAEAIANRYPVYLAAARTEGTRLVAAGKLAQMDLDDMIRNMSDEAENFRRQWTLFGKIANDGMALCRILARRHWQSEDGRAVRFTDSADLDAATAVRGRLQPAIDEVNRIAANARAKSGESLQELQRY